MMHVFYVLEWIYEQIIGCALKNSNYTNKDQNNTMMWLG